MLRRAPFLAALTLFVAAPLRAQGTDTMVPHHEPPCPSCAEWNAPHRPFRVYGNTYYVGTDGLGSILITSSAGHILIDGGLPESAPRIMDNIRALGFRVEDVKLILNSHVHFDHAGGIAMLQRRSGAQVAASPSSAKVLRTGVVGRDDPQYGLGEPLAPVPRVRVVRDGETLHVGSLAITAHFTPGHTPGGTSWSWKSCENGRCEDIVYADSQTPISRDDFYFTRSTTYPNAVQDFQRGQSVLDTLPCGILLTPHPSASSLWERLAKRDAGDADALIDAGACHAFATRARAALAKRIATEQTGH
jgi:metallo-beta-lactamase class B